MKNTLNNIVKIKNNKKLLKKNLDWSKAIREENIRPPSCGNGFFMAEHWPNSASRDCEIQRL